MNSTTEYLRPEADGAVEVPGLGVNADETGDSGNRKESEDRSFWILVSFEDLCNSMGHFGLNIFGSPVKITTFTHKARQQLETERPTTTRTAQPPTIVTVFQSVYQHIFDGLLFNFVRH